MKLARKVFQNRLCPVLLLLCCTFAKAVTAVDEKSRSSAPPPNAKAEEVINFAMIDHRGRFHELRRADGKVIVLFFTGNGSPIARQSIWKLRLLQQRYVERGVIVWMVNSNPEDDRSRLVQEAEGSHSDPLPILKDDTQGVARLLGVKSSGEAIAIGARDWRIFYRGAIDTQSSEGVVNPPGNGKFLETALDEFLDGKPISNPQTISRGSPINFGAGTSGDVSFVKDVAPVLVGKCIVCHRPGDIGSWVMSDYKKAKGMSAMIQEVILARRMPPWSADPHFGKFANDGSLTIAEAQTLLRWVEQGATRGEGNDPLPKAAQPAQDWPLGPPDYIIRLPAPEQIPATGLLDLRHRILNSPFRNEVWIGALDVKPGNRKVVHHVTLRTIYPNQNLADSVPIAGWNPGYMSRRYPEGSGKRLGKDVKFHIDLHYTTTGTPQSDQTEIGFYLLASAPKVPLESRAVWDADFSVPPGEPDLKTFAVTSFDQSSILYNLRPHMHWRGSWFKFELFYPNGKRETLLSVPRYDFNWQTTYILSEPRRVPAGTLMMCTGGFDNSPQNPANPDPLKRVRWGDQSWDEMFIGHFDASSVPGEKSRE